MKKTIFFIVCLMCTLTSRATEYSQYLTTARGFTEVTNTSGLLAGDYYYALCSAENTELMVGVCPAGDRKAWWAPYNSIAMCYFTPDEDPILDRKNFWTIDKSDSYIAFRNLYHSYSLFQTNDGQGFLYFSAFTVEHTISEWDRLTPTYQSGYWMFESGKYPLSGEDEFSGYLGPWNKVVTEGETMALNRKNTTGDLAGHYRLFRIPKATFETLYDTAVRAAFSSASIANPADVTYLITNPSFETGDITGWTMTPTEGNDMGAREYAFSGMEGMYCGNFYCWWNGVSVEQTISNLPSGLYKVSAVLGTWEDRYTVTFQANEQMTSVIGQGDLIGVDASLMVMLDGTSNSLTIKASRDDIDWWSTGRGEANGYPNDGCGFFKIDDVRLIYYGDTPALPNDETTLLEADKWYYYDAPASGRYTLTGNLIGMAYSAVMPDASTTGDLTKSEMGFTAGRIYFKTKRSDATLKVEPVNTATTFTAASMNVDGLPLSLDFPIVGSKDVNPDGPGTTGTQLISSYVTNKGIDVVAFQEDFNYDTNLKSKMSTYNFGTHRASITTDVVLESNRPVDTDGLQFAVRKAIGSFTNESYTKFNSSYSADVINVSIFKQEVNIVDGNSLIKKGYRYYETTIGGEKVDVFITHADAGSTDGSSTDPYVVSRQTQLQQIAQAILAKGNADRPKLFMGDTNCRWTREDLNTYFVNVLSGTYDVGDAWVELARNGVYPTVEQARIADEVVDKFFYINPKGNNKMKLTPISFLRDVSDYVDTSGNALSDHYPVIVKFGLGLYEEVDNTVTIGDIVDNDGMNARDLAALVNILLGNIESNYNLNAADVNQDGYITLADLTMLVNIMPD